MDSRYYVRSRPRHTFNRSLAFWQLYHFNLHYDQLYLFALQILNFFHSYDVLSFPLLSPSACAHSDMLRVVLVLCLIVLSDIVSSTAPHKPLFIEPIRLRWSSRRCHPFVEQDRFCHAYYGKSSKRKTGVYALSPLTNGHRRIQVRTSSPEDDSKQENFFAEDLKMVSLIISHFGNFDVLRLLYSFPHAFSPKVPGSRVFVSGSGSFCFTSWTRNDFLTFSL